MTVVVRPICVEDKSIWLTLWNGFLAFQEEKLSDHVTEDLWNRFFDKDFPVSAYVAENDGQVIGFSHCTLHYGTYTSRKLCYLEDLYVKESSRGKGAGRALINNLINVAAKEDWDRVYWYTGAGNTDARGLYDQYCDGNEKIRYTVYNKT